MEIPVNYVSTRIQSERALAQRTHKEYRARIHKHTQPNNVQQHFWTEHFKYIESHSNGNGFSSAPKNLTKTFYYLQSRAHNTAYTNAIKMDLSSYDKYIYKYLGRLSLIVIWIFLFFFIRSNFQIALNVIYKKTRFYIAFSVTNFKYIWQLTGFCLIGL